MRTGPGVGLTQRNHPGIRGSAGMKQPSSITSLPQSPDQERHSRMIKYTIAMSIRMVCIVSLLFVQGWWLAVAAVGAIALPYIAVVLANVQSAPGKRAAVRPGTLAIGSKPDDESRENR